MAAAATSGPPAGTPGGLGSPPAAVSCSKKCGCCSSTVTWALYRCADPLIFTLSPFHPLGLNAGLISTCTGPFIVNCYVSRAYDEHMGSSAGVYLFLSGQLLKSPSYRWRGQAIMWLMNCSSSFSFGTTGLALPAIKDHLCSCKPTLPNQNI